MATGSDTGASGREIAGKLLLPVTVSLGTAIGLLLTNKKKIREAAPKLREAVSDLPRPHVPEGGVGDLAGELREKVESVLGKEPAAANERTAARIDRGDLEQRRRDRQQRRNRRKQRSRR